MNKLKVGIYLRLSDEDKNKKDESESIKNQRHLLLGAISKHDEFIFFDEYCDEDLSGAGTYRPEFERLIRDCQNKKIDVVMCKSQSRFSRDMEIVEKYINNKFIEWNIRFISLSDNADTENPGNKKSRQINGLVNEWYLEDVSNNIRSAFNAKMKQGEFISPFAPFGYEISKCNNNKLVIDKVASEIVKDIFLLYLKGYGFSGIAKILNDKSIPSPSLYKYQKGIKLNIISNKPREEIKWNSSAIKNILTNEIYLGHLIQGKRTTISYKNHKIINKPKEKWIRCYNNHEKIIDEDIFNKVKEEINKRRKPKSKNLIINPFTKKIFCSECGSYMKKKNSSKHEYIVCSRTQIDNTCSNKNSIRYDKLTEIILEKINILLKKFYDENELKKLNISKCSNTFYDKTNYLKNKIIEKKKELSKLEYFLKNLYEDKINNIITLDQFQTLCNKYDSSKIAIAEELNKLDKEISFYQLKNNNLEKQSLFDKYKKLNSLNKIIVDEFIDKIYIGKIANNERTIEIIWNF